MKKAVVFLADGLEEIEGLTVVDLLRRVGVQVTMVSIKEKERMVTGAHNIVIQADCCFEDVDFADKDLLVLPGGMPGTTNLGSPYSDRWAFWKDGKRPAIRAWKKS